MTRSPKAMLVLRGICSLLLAVLAIPLASAQSKWDQPAAQLADQIAVILGAGQAQLEIVNRSTIATGDLPQIRRVFEQALRTHSIATSGTASANLIRITLSENTRERLWVAEVIEGNDTQVAMVHLDREPVRATPSETGLVLEKKTLWSSASRDALSPGAGSVPPVLAALDAPDGLVLLRPGEISILTPSPSGWRELKHAVVNRRPSSRDPRGVVLPTPDGHGFTAFTAGTTCAGSFGPSADPTSSTSEWAIRCHESDDPWPVTTDEKAFDNPSRNFFTGVITPNTGLDPGPFYSIASIPRPAGHAALLLHQIDGKVQLADGNTVQTVSGTRDWGSDFAVLHSTCGAGTQIIASSSGEALEDSLRAYELPAQEAVPASPALEMGGSVTALFTDPDARSVLAIVRKSESEYEVDRVSAICP